MTRILPNFVIIGAQKSGTTWLADMLRQHPEVFVASQEIHYFDKEQNFRHGFDWYVRHFEKGVGKRAIGEKTPDYFWPNGRGTDGHRPDVHRSLHETLPRARLIVILRDPVARAISAARHLVMDGWVSPFFDLDDLLVGRGRAVADEHGVVDYGFYARHLEAYLELFPREQILVLIYEEDIVAQPRVGLRKCCEFLAIDTDFRFCGLGRRRNELRKSFPHLLLDYYAPALRRRSVWLDRIFPLARYEASEAAREELRRIYAPANERLFHLLGPRPAAWSGQRRPAASGGEGDDETHEAGDSGSRDGRKERDASREGGDSARRGDHVRSFR